MNIDKQLHTLELMYNDLRELKENRKTHTKKYKTMLEKFTELYRSLGDDNIPEMWWCGMEEIINPNGDQWQGWN